MQKIKEPNFFHLIRHICHAFDLQGLPHKLQAHVISIVAEQVVEVAPAQYDATK